MFRRYKELLPAFPPLKLEFGFALRDRLRYGYKLGDLRSDLLAGIVVGAVAIPLSMALAIASGVAPQFGLYTVIFSGIIVALLGGSRFQVTGPTAAFVVILAPIAANHGFSGLLIAGFMAGIILIAMGAAGLGQLIQFIPHTVTTGFTAGIALVIGVIQLNDFFGLAITHMPQHFTEKVVAIFSALPSFNPQELAIGTITLLMLIFIPRLTTLIPAPIITILLVTSVVAGLEHFYPTFHIATIGSRFSFSIGGQTGQGIPSALPSFASPWSFNGGFSFEMIRTLLPDAFAIAMLGAIESLLSAVIADGMTRTRHNPDAELLALGVSNMVCHFSAA
jgi:SulP family sulfate permease